MVIRYDPRALRRFRKQRAYGLEDLARRARLSPRGLVYLERGREPRAGTLARLASALEVSVAAFFRAGRRRAA